MKLNISPTIIMIIMLEILIVFSLLYFLGEIKLARIVLIVAVCMIIFFIILLLNNKISKKEIIKILSPYWKEYLMSNYALEREIQLKKFVSRHRKLLRKPGYFYVSRKVISNFWFISRSCVELKEYLPKDAWKKYLEKYLENNLGFPEREIRLLIAIEILKYVKI